MNLYLCHHAFLPWEIIRAWTFKSNSTSQNINSTHYLLFRFAVNWGQLILVRPKRVWSSPCMQWIIIWRYRLHFYHPHTKFLFKMWGKHSNIQSQHETEYSSMKYNIFPELMTKFFFPMIVVMDQCPSDRKEFILTDEKSNVFSSLLLHISWPVLEDNYLCSNHFPQNSHWVFKQKRLPDTVLLTYFMFISTSWD